jgi:predicted transcriptional regulator
VIFLVTPTDLWFLPKDLTDANSIFALVFGLVVCTAFFGGGVLQLYNLADRGFSLRILIDIVESPRQELTLDEILENYGSGKGIDWMYQKRIEGMLDNQMIIMENGDIQITEKGLKIAKYFSRMRKFLNLGADSNEEKV